MAKKEALRDLQNRLSERLRLAQTQTVSMAWLAVMIGPQPCLFPLAQSGEIFSLARAMSVPYTRPWFAGVVNLRGGLYGVLDLARFLDATLVRKADEQALARARLITLNVDLGVNCALIVDGLMGLRRPDAFKAEEPTAPGSPTYFGRRYLDEGGLAWQEINLLALSQNSEFLAVGT
jgi:twitching motility protein PilI